MADTTQAPRTIPGNAPAGERPDTRRPEYTAGIPARRLSRAMIEGTKGVRAMGKEALPMWPGENPGFYKLRSTIAQLTRYYARTVGAVASMVAGDPPTLAKGANARIVADWEDIDRRGTHGGVFARDLVQEMIDGGYSAILVDSPPVPDGLGLTLEDEQAMGLRPYWVLLSAEQIISWVTESPDWNALMDAWNLRILTAEQVGRLARQEIVRQVTIHEPHTQRAGAFGVSTRDRYRVLSLSEQGVTFVVWEHVPKSADGSTGEHFRVVGEGAMLGAKRQPLSRIPLAIAYPKRPEAPFVSEPPLLAVAELNLDHYQLTTDRRYLIKLTHSPTLYMLGFKDEKDAEGQSKPVKVGPNSVIKSSNADAKVGYASAPGDSLAASKDERDDLVRQIAALGMSFIDKDHRGNVETARGRAMDQAAENATHASMSIGAKDALEQAMVFHALHYDVPPASVDMHTVYASPDVDPQLANVLWLAVLNGKLDVDTWLDFLRTGRLPEDTDMGVIAARLLAEAAAGMANDDARARDLAGEGDGAEGDKLPEAA